MAARNIQIPPPLSPLSIFVPSMICYLKFSQVPNTELSGIRDFLAARVDALPLTRTAVKKRFRNSYHGRYAEAVGLNQYTSLEPANRGSPVCISTSMHPRLHMSMARSYGKPRRTSGER